MNDPSNPICTRCGYPLPHPEVGAGETVFRCPECGMTWTMETLARENAQPWLLEVHGARQPIRTVMRAVTASFRPRRFWRSAVFDRDVKHVTLGPVALAVLTPLVIATVIGGGSMFWYIIVHQRMSLEPISAQIAALRSMLVDFMQYVGTLFIGPAVLTLLMPVPFFIAQSRRRSRGIGSRHLFRVMLYSFVWPAWLGLVWCLAFFSLLYLNRPDMALYLTPYVFDTILPTPVWMPAGFMFVVATIIYGLYASWWWLQASRHYLRLDQTWLLVISAGILSFCGALVVQFWIAVA